MHELGTTHGRQGDGFQEGDQDRAGQGDAELEEKLADDPLHESHGQEDGHDGDGGGDGREGDFAGAFQGRFHHAFPLFLVADDVFQNHDGVIHHDSDGKGKGQKGEGVQGKAEEINDDESPEEGSGDGQEDVEGGGPASQEKITDQGGENGAHAEGQFQLMEVLLDGGGGGEVLVNMETSWHLHAVLFLAV